MKLFVHLAVVVTCLSFVSVVFSQEKESPLDKYLATAKTIVVAKCLEVGPINILMKAHVDIEIVQVVKGKETPRKIIIVSQFGMEEGKYYLLRTENDATKDGIYFTIDTRDSVIPIAYEDEVKELKTLSPRIIVLRTMNLRIHHLENKIRRDTYEMEALKAIRKDS